MTTFIIWAEGDATVGDGTFNAKLEVDVILDQIHFVKSMMRRTCSELWDVREKRVNVMTQAEYDAYLGQEEQD